ncbi:formylglycine-generating enzyme family protein [Citrobacter braakii]|uniref:formylglycine-generating enzyme family protein n=1 Tax=Citrobacter braakii TaxID=57706 RepID=UPI001F3BD6FA|nr:SUMF1/EgtB/PvdO family nonheme iron enzyme [Citrobacter braakii]MCF2475363.1 formylglycine-generating enzyme family protein [Citrobacter braakii]WFV23563.1 formylglycine-generating enzyme family protein [Citrobacter braakii]
MKIKYPLLLLSLAVSVVAGCDQNPTSVKPRHSTEDQARLQEFVTQIKSELVFVEGGEYLMGDFGEEYGVERLQYDGRKDSKPLHRVELSSYSLSKFKASNQQYQFYLAWNGLSGRKVDKRLLKRWREKGRIPDAPAHVDWHEAERYCAWLGEVTGLPFSLPTEAQWEYAARNRGKFVVAPTDDGTIRIEGQKGINVATATDREIYARKSESSLDIDSPLPRDFRPPNPLGIYDMAGNGWEWMKDWYDPEYYSQSPVKDPQGPEQPVFKDPDGYYTRVLRSQDFSGPGRGLTMVRYKADPESRPYLPTDKTARCAVNHPGPVK